VTGVGAFAALEVSPHDPLVEHEAIGAEQHQVSPGVTEAQTWRP